MRSRAGPGEAASVMTHESSTLVRLADAGSWDVKTRECKCSKQHTSLFPKQKGSGDAVSFRRPNLGARGLVFSVQNLIWLHRRFAVSLLASSVVGSHEVLTHWAAMHYVRSVGTFSPATQA